MAEQQKSILILGAGPAGMAAAARAAQLGVTATLVSDGPVGGRAGWHSLLPSKVWLTAAVTALNLQEAHITGFPRVPSVPQLNESVLLAHLSGVRQQWNEDQAAWLRQRGVNIVPGRGQFVGPDTVEIADGDERRQVSADSYLIATGSVPMFPPGLKPDGERVIAPRFASALSQLPESVVVIGGGATGSEFAFLFNRLGVRTTWVIDAFGVLPGQHPELGSFLRDALAAQGVTVVEGSSATQIDRTSGHVVVHTANGETIQASMAFVAVGRRPDLADLGLETAGVEMVAGIVRADAYGGTTNPRVFVAGDAAGGRLVANKAMAQGAVAVEHALGRPVRPYDPGLTVLATYTDPEIAQVGELSGDGLRIARLDAQAALKGRLDSDAQGFVLIAYHPQNGLLAGGAAAGRHAADILAPLALGLRLRATIEDLAAMYVAHPTAGELLFAAAREAGWPSEK